MLNVSNEFIQATKQYTRASYTKYIFTLVDGSSLEIYEEATKGNCKINNQCVNSNGFNLGSACIGEVSFSVENSYINTNLVGSSVKIIHGLHTSKGEEEISLGVFNITKATKKDNLISITGSDNIMKLDKSFYDSDDYDNRINTIVQGLSNFNNLYSHIIFICNSCEVILGQTKEEIELLELYETGQSNLYRLDNGTITASPRDFLGYIAQILGGFAYADSDGYIKIKRFGTSPIYTVDYSQMISNSFNESDFQMRLYGGYYQDEDNSWGKVWYPAYENLPNSIIVDTSENPFLQQYYQDNGLPMDIIGNICLSVGSINYIPFEITIIGNYALEVGDCITIYRKDNSFFTSVITHISYQTRGNQTLKCVGEDTRTLGNAVRNQTTRLAETTQKKFNDVKGVDLSQSEFDNLDTTDLKEGKTYYVY